MEENVGLMQNLQLDFEQAKTKHLLFKSNLRAILYGDQSIDETPVLSHFECTVGKWIYGHALKLYGHIPEMQELESVHADIHLSARKLVALYKDGKIEEARTGFSEIEKIADHLVGLLALVEHKLSISPPKTANPQIELESTRKELNELLLANEALDKKIREQSGVLIRERQLLHNFFMQAPAIFCILKSPEHVFELANEGYMELIGERNLIGRRITEVLPLLESQGFLKILNDVYETGNPFIGTDVFFQVDKNKDGNLVNTYINFIYQALKDLEGNIEGILVFAYDVTSQVIARKKTEESEQLFHTLANSISQLAWMAHPHGWIYWYNDRWYEYTGTTLEEMQGWGWEKVHHPEHIAQVVADVKHLWETTEPFELTFPLKRKDGIYRWFLTRVYPLKNQHGEVIQWIGTNTDIDDQKKALEQKDEFLSIASHELKTPVTSLKGFTQILQMKFKKEENQLAADLLSKMDKQVDKLTKLIIDLLDATKIENGQLQFSVDEFDFDELVKEEIEEIQRTVQSHEIVFQASGTKTISGDRNRIGQVIINFISNAVKYAPNTKQIIVSTELKDGKVFLSVQDFGIGISDNEQKKIFERFFRVTDAGNTTFPGLGLGLYISAEIIKRHKGKITVKSEAGTGSVFSFELPVTQVVKSKEHQ